MTTLDEFLEEEHPGEDVLEAVDKVLTQKCSSTTQLLLALAEAQEDGLDDADGASKIRQFAREFAEYELDQQ